MPPAATRLAKQWDAKLAREGLASLDSSAVWLGSLDGEAEKKGPRDGVRHRTGDQRLGVMVSKRGQGGDALLGAEEIDRRRVLLAEHTFPGTDRIGRASTVRPRRDKAIYALYADGWKPSQIARRYRTSFWAVRRAIVRVERSYALRKAEGPTREMLARFARDADPGLVALVFMLLERTLEQPEAGREILRTARDIPELRGLLDG